MCVDILKELAALLGFRFNVSLVPDGKYGSLKPYGWTGMVRDLKNDVSDVFPLYCFVVVVVVVVVVVMVVVVVVSLRIPGSCGKYGVPEAIRVDGHGAGS